jgi:hypothetical protein
MNQINRHIDIFRKEIKELKIKESLKRDLLKFSDGI